MFSLILFTHLSIDHALANDLPQAGTTQVPLTAEMIRELRAGGPAGLLEAARPFIDGDERRREGCLSVTAPGWPPIIAALTARAQAFAAHRAALAIEPSARGLYELAALQLPPLPCYPPNDLGDKPAITRVARAREITRRLEAEDHVLADAVSPAGDLEPWLPWSVRQIRLERADALVAGRQAWLAEVTAAIEAAEAAPGDELPAVLSPVLRQHTVHGATPPALLRRWEAVRDAVRDAIIARRAFAVGVFLRDYGTPDQIARYDLDMLPSHEVVAAVNEVAFRPIVAAGWTVCDLGHGSFQTEVPAPIWPAAKEMLALAGSLGGTVTWWRSEHDDDGESWSAVVKLRSPIDPREVVAEEFLLPAASES